MVEVLPHGQHQQLGDAQPRVGLGAQVAAISADGLDSHARFAEGLRARTAKRASRPARFACT